MGKWTFSYLVEPLACRGGCQLINVSFTKGKEHQLTRFDLCCSFKACECGLLMISLWARSLRWLTHILEMIGGERRGVDITLDNPVWAASCPPDLPSLNTQTVCSHCVWAKSDFYLNNTSYLTQQTNMMICSKIRLYKNVTMDGLQLEVNRKKKLFIINSCDTTHVIGS